MDSIKELAKLVARYIKGDEKKTKAYDTSATVKRIANGIAYVQIPGGVSETPVKLTIDAKKGDTVQVRVANGTAWLVGNRTAPPTDDTTANIAKTKATTAEKVATVAEEAAGEAQVKANAAASEAAAAKQIADNTEQHFWFTETGADTGAHIAEITKDEWDVSQSGGNLLARSNGIAVRDGMTELASFSGTNGAVIGKVTESHVAVKSTGQVVYADDGITEIAAISYDNVWTDSMTPEKGAFFTFGSRTGSIGENTISAGANNQVGANNSAAFGIGNSVLPAAPPSYYMPNSGCIAAGLYLDAKYSHQAVFGCYNDNKINDLLEIGNGDSSTRANALEVDNSGNLTAAGNITVEGHTSAIGTIYNANKSINITSTDVDTYATGAAITLPIGKYVVRAQASFPSNSTEAIRRVQIYNSTSSSSLTIISEWDRYWVSHDCTRICNVTTNNTVLQCRVSAGVAINSVSTLIEAIRIA